jgi:periplasmic protein CpxP/Spy
MRGIHVLGVNGAESATFKTRNGSMWSKRWFKRGVLLALVPLTALGCHGRWHGHHKVSDAEMQERVEEGVEDVLDYVDAEEQQVQPIKQVVSAAATDMKAFRSEHHALRKEFQEALSAEKIDADQLEGLRVNALDLVDRASARVLAAVVDVGNLLTPEQRKKLVNKWKQFQH